MHHVPVLRSPLFFVLVLARGGVFESDEVEATGLCQVRHGPALQHARAEPRAGFAPLRIPCFLEPLRPFSCGKGLRRGPKAPARGRSEARPADRECAARTVFAVLWQLPL